MVPTMGIAVSKGEYLDDCTAEIMDAVMAAHKAGGGTVRLEKRYYDFYPERATRLPIPVSNHDRASSHPVQLPFVGITNVTLEAENTTFRFHGNCIGLAAVDSEGINIRGVRFMWPRPWFAELSVTGFENGKTHVRFNPSRFDCRVVDGKLMLFGEDWTSHLERAAFFSGKTRALVPRSSDMYIKAKVERTGPCEIAFHEDLSKPVLGRTGIGLQIGDTIVIRSKDRLRPAICLYRTMDAMFDKVFVHGGFGMGLLAQFCENVEFCNGGVKPLYPEEFSSHTVDATHFSSVKGLVKVENCIFEGMLDDAINVHATSAIIEEVQKRRVVCRDRRMDGVSNELFKKGDNVRFIKGVTLENGPVMKVTGVEKLAEDLFALTVDGDVPVGYGVEDAVENVDWYPNVVFRGNTVRNNRARATLFTSAKPVLCESNIFERVSGAAIRVSGDAIFWYETGPVSQLTIRGNVFDGCQLRGKGGAVIVVDPMVKHLKAQKRNYHGRIVVQDNVFRNIREGKMFSAYSLDELEWSGNVPECPVKKGDKPGVWSVDTLHSDKEAEVKVSSFGFNEMDSTCFIQRALDSGFKRLVVDKKDKPWISGPLTIRSDTEIVFEEGVEVLAKKGAFKHKRAAFWTLCSVSNVTMRALGKGASIKMRIKDYHSSQYEKSEWRHAINMLSAENISVSNLVLYGSGGDGIYLGVDSSSRLPNRNVTISDCVCDNNNRQGISVISADTLLIERTVMKNTKGTSPKSGIDFEPNSPGDKLCNIMLRDCVTEDNDGNGYQLYAGQLNSSSEPITITLENCRSVRDKCGALVVEFDPGRRMAGLPKGGFLNVRNCCFTKSAKSAVTIINKPKGVMDVRFENCRIGESATGYPEVNIETSAIELPPTDGIVFDNVDVTRVGDSNWSAMQETPWDCGGIRHISGIVNLHSGGRTKRIILDEEKYKNVASLNSGKDRFEIVPFDYGAKVAAVDLKPGQMVPLSPVKLRFSADVLVYAAKPGRILLSARIHRVNKRPLSKSPFKVFDMRGVQIAELPCPREKDTLLQIDAPEAGFYRIACAVKPNAVVFTACNSPIGILPPQAGLGVFMGHRGTIDVYKSECDIYFAPNGGKWAFLCGGNDDEKVSVSLYDAGGSKVFERKNLGEWGFFGVKEVSRGLWRARIGKPDVGHVWEDSYLALLGAPSVFFLTNQKYWEIIP